MCESRRDGRCSCCERGVLGGEGVSCHQYVVMGQVVHRWAAWLLFKVCAVLKGLRAVSSWAGEVHPTQLERGRVSAPR